MMGENGENKNWSKVSLKDNVDILTGFAFKSKKFNEITGIPLIRIRDLNTHNPVTLYDGPYSEDYIVNKLDILVGMDGEFNIVKWKGPKSLLNQRVAKLNSTNTDLLDENFMFYKMHGELKEIERITPATTVKHLSKKDIQNLNLHVPPIKEQRKIAAILSSVDEAIEKTEQIIEQTEKVKKGLMQELLTKGIGHTEFKESPVGRIPKEWSINYLEELVNFQNGKAHEKYVVDDGNYILINSKFISTDGQEMKKTNKNLLPLYSNDIAMVMSDVPNGKAIAKCFYTEEENIYTVNQRVCRLEPKNIYGKYLYYYLNRNRYFLSFDNGVSQTNLRKQEVLDCPVKVPTMKEQEKIVKILDELERAIEIEYKKRTHLARLKQGLMQQLLTGKKRVKVDESEEVLS